MAIRGFVGERRRIDREAGREVIGQRSFTAPRAHELQRFTHRDDAQPTAQIAAPVILADLAFASMRQHALAHGVANIVGERGATREVCDRGCQAGEVRRFEHAQRRAITTRKTRREVEVGHAYRRERFGDGNVSRHARREVRDELVIGNIDERVGCA